MIVAGFDPGLAALGQARIERSGSRYVCSLAETVRTKPSSSDDARMLEIWQSLTSGDVLAFEEQHGVFSGKAREGRADGNSAKVREVVGLLRARAYHLGADLVVIPPSRVRSSLGLPPGAGKAQVRAVVERLVSGLPRTISQHAVDAVAVAIAGERAARAIRRGAA